MIRLSASTLAIAAGAIFAAGGSTPASAAANVSHVAAPVPRDVATARFLTAAPAAASLHFTIVLPLRNRPELSALIRVQSTRRSPFYRHFLKPAQFAARYGPDARTVEAAVRELRGSGIAVTSLNATHTLLKATAPIATIDRTFSTSIGMFARSGRAYYANRTPALAPAALASLGITAVGLDNIPHARPMHVLGFRHAALAARSMHHRMRIGRFATSGAAGGYTPSDLAQAYDFPLNAGNTGSGASVGIVISNDYQDGDVNAFFSSYGVNRTGSLGREPIDGGGSFDPQQSVEVTLDVEQSASLAPGANETVYEIPDLSNQSILDAYNAVVTDNTADVISSSFGGCEQGASVDNADDQVFSQGVAQGQTWFASSGDQGSNCYPSNATGVSMPSSDPNVVAVGGTTLSTDNSGSYAGESAWSGSGGGVSSDWALPSYQQNIAGEASTSNRNVPDVALNADPNSGDELVFQGQDSTVGGTSASSPDVAAEFASIVGAKGRQGLANNRIYALAAAGGPFHDVTSGSNGAYGAGPGYDNVTGWGSFDGNALLNAF